MKRLCAVGAVLSMLAAPAYAQYGMNTNEKEPLKKEYEERQKEHKATEKAYEDAIKRTRGHVAPVSNDPWASVRPSEPSKGKR